MKTLINLLFCQQSYFPCPSLFTMMRCSSTTISWTVLMVNSLSVITSSRVWPDPSSVAKVLPAPGPRSLCPGRRWPHPAPPKNIRNVFREELHKQVNIMNQETDLFNDSLCDNIGYV